MAAGEIRPDIGPEDLLRALVGMCYLHDQPGWQASVLRLLDVFVDGLSVQSDAGAMPSSGDDVTCGAKGQGLPGADLE